MKHLLGVLIGLATVTGAQAQTVCDHSDFGEFYEWFIASPDNQKAASADRLGFVTFQAVGSSKPARYTEMVAREDVEWPVMPSEQELNARGFEVKRREMGDGRARVNAFQKDGRETSLSWWFKMQPCWTLTEVVDGTILR